VGQFAARGRIGSGEAPERLGNLGGCPLQQFTVRGLAIGADAGLVPLTRAALPLRAAASRCRTILRVRGFGRLVCLRIGIFV
jgi:hypothetical protein